MSESYFCVEKTFENTIIINKSIFITTLTSIKSLEDAQKQIKSLAKKYSDATHTCFAVIADEVGNEQKCSDDGEPQGTAGIPILEVLKKRKIFMTLATVTRYFGGIKLGASGLIGAYSSSVATALENAETVEKKLSYLICFLSEYSSYKTLAQSVEKCGGQIVDTEFFGQIKVKMQIPIDKIDLVNEKLTQLTFGKTKLEILEKNYYAYKMR